jgi:hypothetical protein
MKNRQFDPKKVDYPENLKVGRNMRAWERVELMKRSGFTNQYISAMFSGKRRMTDEIKRMIIEIKKEAQELNQALEEAIQEE